MYKIVNNWLEEIIHLGSNTSLKETSENQILSKVS